MSMKKSLLIRTDAGPEIGIGHVTRCFALGYAWRERGGDAIFFGTGCEFMAESMRQAGIRLIRAETAPGSGEDAAATAELCRNVSCAVLDGYHFGSGFQERIRSAGVRLAVIDDYGHLDHYAADIILNQNCYASEELYRARAPSAQLLLGTEYALLRPVFSSWSSWEREIPETARKVLITLGGGNAGGAYVKAVRALSDMDNPYVRILIGPVHPDRSSVEKEIAGKKEFQIHGYTEDMPSLLAWADIAVTAGGSTCWEAAFMGLPSVLIVLADNQERIADCLDRIGAAINLGCEAGIREENMSRIIKELACSRESRTRMSRLGRETVDGRGAARAAERLLN